METQPTFLTLFRPVPDAAENQAIFRRRAPSPTGSDIDLWGYQGYSRWYADRQQFTAHGSVFGVGIVLLVLFVRCADGHRSRATPCLRCLFFFPFFSDIVLLGAFSSAVRCSFQWYRSPLRAGPAFRLSDGRFDGALRRS